jgi:integrase
MTKLELPVRNCLKLLILTGARNSEIREATWYEFDLNAGIWVLPANRSKTNDTVRRPLSTESIRLLKELKMAYPVKHVIPSTDSNLLKPITTHAIARAMRRIRTKLCIDDFVPHDFRRTIVIRLSEINIPPHVIEKMLGHKLGGVMAVYNKHDWINEPREAYEHWWRLISLEMQ